MIKLALVLLCLFTSQELWARGAARVVMLKGEVSFGGKPLTKNSLLQGTGILWVKKKSYVKLILEESKNSLAFGANTEAKINISAPPEKQEVYLFKGLARWITGKSKGGGIKTQNAIMGVRGTDFHASFNPLLKETEIICFSGAVQLTNEQDKSDSLLVKKNQWGGIGGRFGTRLSRTLDLSPELITHFESAWAD